MIPDMVICGNMDNEAEPRTMLRPENLINPLLRQRNHLSQQRPPRSGILNVVLLRLRGLPVVGLAGLHRHRVCDRVGDGELIPRGAKKEAEIIAILEAPVCRGASEQATDGNGDHLLQRKASSSLFRVCGYTRGWKIGAAEESVKGGGRRAKRVLGESRELSASKKSFAEEGCESRKGRLAKVANFRCSFDSFRLGLRDPSPALSTILLSGASLELGIPNRAKSATFIGVTSRWSS